MIKELITAKQLDESFEVIKELRVNLDLNTFRKIYKQMHNDGYKIFGLYEKNQIVTLAGVGILTNFYYDRYLFIYDLVTKKEYKNRGFGKQMMQFLEEYSKKNGCINIALTSGLERVDAHRFYEKIDFEKRSFAFVKSIK